MIKVIMGLPGSGKTKQLIELVNVAVNKEAGHVVCIEKGEKLRFEIKYDARLIDITEYNPLVGFDYLYSFICGVYSGNYDTTHIFLDNLYKVADCNCAEATEKFLDKLNVFADKSGVKFTVTISADVSTATEGMKKYF